MYWFRNTSSASGCGDDLGFDPALTTSNLLPAVFFRMNSAKMLRAELPVQRKRSLNFGFVGSILAAGFLGYGAFDPVGACLHLGEPGEIFTEKLVGGYAVLEALEIGLQLSRRRRREAVDDPGALAGRLDHVALAKIGEVLRDLGLRELQHILEMAHTQRPLGQQIHDPEPDRFAEALVDAD